MYDISQLNDLLVPELQDIAEQLDISNANKLLKQDLINKILENQSIMSADKKKDGEKPKRKRIAKPSAKNNTDDSAVKPKKTDTEKKPVNAGNEDAIEEIEIQPITSEESTIPPAIAQMLAEEDIQEQEPEVDIEEDNKQTRQQSQKQQSFGLYFSCLIRRPMKPL